ncbi:MAG: transposase [Deltaproteobacteria bacterium]|nr:transposase [Deltaproteobacteria bacterium]
MVVRQSIAVRPKASGKQPTLFKNLDQWGEYRISLMITNDQDSTPEEIWKEYRPRANDENVIKSLKEGFGLAAFNMESFWATEAVMVMNALVFHNLIHYLNRTILNKKGPVEQLRTIRGKYFLIAAQLGKSSGYEVLRLAVRDRTLRAKLSYFLELISLISHRLNCIAVEIG